ncbi:hypothetical protein [Riemerella columbina]|uniref:hypothetical protein n=1 Tax=Riemerella columbina TaxID=103810 RepID=UPI0003787C00|nr:hypothetical protein [Riemerella columbina]
MALDNLISIRFTDQELQTLNTAIQQINQVLQGKVINLSPEERQQYGSIADRNKVLVDKCKHYMEQDTETLPRTIDKTEFDADYHARQQLDIPLKALSRIVEKMSDTKILLDHDNFHSAIAYYRYIKYLSSQNEPGTTSIYQDLKKHYQSASSKVKDEASGGSEAPSGTS